MRAGALQECEGYECKRCGLSVAEGSWWAGLLEREDAYCSI